MKKKSVYILLFTIIMVALMGCGRTKAENTDSINSSSIVSPVDVNDTEISEENKVDDGEDKSEEVIPNEISEAEEQNNTEENNQDDNLDEINNNLVEENEENALANVTSIEPSKTLYLTADVNIRKGPSTDYDVIAHGKLNQEISAIGRDKDGWYEFMLGDEIAFVSDKYVSESPIAEAVVLTNNTPPSTNVNVAAPAGVLFIGDSRCVQMREATGGGGCSWICKNGARYEWFAETAVPQADTMVGKGTKVIICMGVNDPGDVDKYATLTNLMTAQWVARGAKVYYVSVNPVWENPYTSEEQVTAFNSSIVGQLMGVKYIDTHSYLMGSGYKLVDGLHYDAPTYLSIFSAIIASL